MKNILILGATGSIGCSTIDVIKAHPNTFRAQALVANSNITKLAEIALDVQPEAVGIYDETRLDELKQLLSGSGIAVYSGKSGVNELIAKGYDLTMSAIVGIAGLEPTMNAIKSSRTVALVNKESLVCAGELIMAQAKKYNCTILPVDSEHSAIFQVFENNNLHQIDKVILTASGGPFRKMTAEEMAVVTPAAAIAHPNWKMGPKVSLDCATLINKGLEYIEACVLFPVTPDQVDVVIHPESIIHSLVSYKDGSTLAQLGHPDMRTPISFAISYPQRIEIKHKTLNLHEIGTLNFSAPDYNRFPMLKMAMESMRAGLAQRIILNAANEEAGQAFLNNKIKFPDLAKLVGNALEQSPHKNPDSVEEVLGLDKMIRAEIVSKIAQC